MEETKESDEDESYCDLAALLPAKARAIKKYGEVFICAGDYISYYQPLFTASKNRIRRARVLAVEPLDRYPLQINTEESLNRFTLVRLNMNDGQAGTGPLRQLHTFSFTRGRIEAPTMREELGAVFRQIRESAFAAAFSSDRVERRGDSESAVVGSDGDEAIAGSSSDDVDDGNTETGQHEEFVTEYPSANIGVETEVRYPSASIGVETEVRNEPETPPTVFPNDDMAEQPNGLAGAFGVLARPDDRNMYRLINDDGAGDDLACGDFVGMAFDSEEDAFTTSRFTHLPIQNPTVGKRYESASAAMAALKDYAFATKKSVKVSCSGGTDRTIVCDSKTKGCSFFVRLYKQKAGNAWYISSMNLDHSECSSTPNPTMKQIAAMPTFLAAVQANGEISATALIGLIRNLDGICLESRKRTVYRAREFVKDLSKAELRASYSVISSYLARLQELNPGSLCRVERDSDHRFQRAIVVLKATTHSVPFNQHILGIDCSHSKCPNYGGQQMHLVGRDGNLQNVTVAFALVESEDISCYNWFFDMVREAGVVVEDTPIFCDRNSALVSVGGSRDLVLRHCTMHILRNINKGFPQFNIQRDRGLIWGLQAAYTNTEYESRLAWIKKEFGDEMEEYIRRIDPAKWCVHANIGVRPLYGWRTSNFVESVFGTQLALCIRALPPLAFLKAMCTRITTRVYQRSVNATEWISANRTITPGAMKIYDKQLEQAGFYTVVPSSDDIFSVYRTDRPVIYSRRYTRSVNHCTCGFIDQYRIPCRHAIAAMIFKKRLHNMFDLFDSCYRVESYASAFQGQQIILPIEEELTVDNETLPPGHDTVVGRPPTARIPSTGEEVTSGTKRYYCSVCKTPGHNKRKCKSNREK